MTEYKSGQAAVRPAAVAGMFYPAAPNQLRAMLGEMLDAARTEQPAPKALIAPHAGYIYSGQAAAAVYARLKNCPQAITRVVLLGPAHRVGFQGIAGPTADYFATPLGNIPLDKGNLERAFRLEGVAPFDHAHAEEHSLEVQLPFLQMVLGEFQLAPFVVGQVDAGLVARLLEVLWGGAETLVVVSSDLSHYLDYASAQQRDRRTTQHIEALAGAQIGPHDACGCTPIRGLLLAAQHKGLAVETVALCNSGDTAGDKSRVVGYGAYALR